MLVLVALAAFGCTSSCPSCTDRVEVRGPVAEAAACPQPECPACEPPPVVAPSRPEPPPAAWSVARLSEDLNGDGTPEVIELLSDGRLELAGHSYQLTLHHEMRQDQPEQRYAGIEVVDVRRGDGRREVLFWQEGEGDYDPPREYVFFSLREGELLATETMSAPVRPIVRGDGRILFEFEYCVSDGRSARWRIEHRMTRAGVIRPELSTTRHVDTDCVLAACPYVFVGAERPVLVGEILRDLRDSSLEGEQSLDLPADSVAADGTLTVTLRELKPEITHLDAIHVVADGRVVMPRACGDAPWCAIDGQRLSIRMGEERVFVFDVGSSPTRLRLVANGYYEPYSSVD